MDESQFWSQDHRTKRYPTSETIKQKKKKLLEKGTYTIFKWN